MTREEAINIMLQMMKDEEDFLSDDTVEAHKMAIQALSQEPCDDAVSRQYLLDNCVVDKATMPYVPVNKIKNAPPVTQKPIECDDAISRDAALEKMADYVASGYADSAEDFLGYSRIICQLPPVTQKSETVTEFADRCRECGKMRKGHWIYDETIDNWRYSKCNETPKTMGYVGTADFMAEHFKFCNHCGAKMVEPQESEDECNHINGGKNKRKEYRKSTLYS